jgi:hypothetical protein
MNQAIIDDKNLPSLRQAMDPGLMAPAFEDFFSRQYPDRRLKVRACQVCRVYHKPGKNCDILYRLSGHDREERGFDQWFFAKISANDGDGSKAGKNAPVAWPGCDFWKPVSAWPEMSMVLHAFPYDPKLPYLGQLLDADFVRRQIEAHLPGLGLSTEWKCREVTCHKIKYMAGKRCILRYELVMTDTQNHHKPFVFYSKTYSSAKSRYVYEALRRLCASPACLDGSLSIPEPVAHVEAANTLWQKAWEGKKLPAVMNGIGWENFHDTGFPEKIASVLAALHQVEMPEAKLASGPSPALMVENVYGDVQDIMAFVPEKRAELEALTKTLGAWAPNFDGRAPRATIHGSFKVAQLLCREQELGLVDFDSIANGDPLYDVAEFIASLVFLIVSDNIPAASIAKSVEIFLASYQKQVPWECDRQRLSWYVSAFLLGKIHAALKRMEPETIENMGLAFEVVREWMGRIKRNA